MYLGIDIGGTKTFVAALTDDGVIQEQLRFATPHDYPGFLRELTKSVASLTTKSFIGGCVALPGRIDRPHGIGVACGNLPWKNIPIEEDCARIAGCPFVVENDANLAGLSEAMLLKNYDRVLYVTISTGIGTGFIVHQAIDPAYADSEGGHMELEHEGKIQIWEAFASGRAMTAKYGKQAHEITDAQTWREVARNIGIGLIDLIAVMQPEVIVLGGGVGHYLDQFSEYLIADLKAFETPLVPIPPIVTAQRPDEAVVYGCYDLARSKFGA